MKANESLVKMAQHIFEKEFQCTKDNFKKEGRLNEISDEQKKRQRKSLEQFIKYRQELTESVEKSGMSVRRNLLHMNNFMDQQNLKILPIKAFEETLKNLKK